MVSSADAEKMSLTIKFALVGAIPAIMQAIGLACGFNVLCIYTTPTELEAVALTIANLAYLTLSAVAAVGFILSFFRKVSRTIVGANAAFPSN